MTAGATAAATFVAAAVALLVWPAGRAELFIWDPTAGRHFGAVGAPGVRRPGPVTIRRYAAAAGPLLATVLVVPGLWWCGLLAAVPLAWYLGRRAGRLTPAQQVEQRRELAGRLDLIAACLRSGLPIGSALLAIGDTGQPAGAGAGSATSPIEVLDEVAAMLMIGADPQTAWRPAAERSELAAVAAAACRSASGGTALADAFSEQAGQLRRQNAEAAATAAGRAGVLMTAPLGACFLPAFLCLGLAPAVVGLLGSLHLW